jgi:hypothetical protein
MFRTPGYPLLASDLVLFESSSRILLSNFYNCTAQQIGRHERVVTSGLPTRPNLPLPRENIHFTFP